MAKILSDNEIMSKTKNLAKEITNQYQKYLNAIGIRNQQRQYNRLKNLEDKMKVLRSHARERVKANELLARQRHIPKQAKLRGKLKRAFKRRKIAKR